MSDTTSLEKLLVEWHRRASINKDAHYDAGSYFAKSNYSLGIPVIVLSAVVGTSVFATLEQQVDLWIKIVIGLINVSVAVLGSLQTFFGYAERVEKHRLAGAKYGSIARELEQAIVTGNIEDEKEFLDKLRERMDTLSQEAPQIPYEIWRRAEAWHAKTDSNELWTKIEQTK
jgi:hypothetical protein